MLVLCTNLFFFALKAVRAPRKKTIFCRRRAAASVGCSCGRASAGQPQPSTPEGCTPRAAQPSCARPIWWPCCGLAQPCASSLDSHCARRSEVESKANCSRKNCTKNEPNWRSVVPSASWKPSACVNMRNESNWRSESGKSISGRNYCIDVRDESNRRFECPSSSEGKKDREPRRIGRSLHVVCAAEGEGQTKTSRLGSIIKNKQRILESQLRSMSEGELESRLSGMQAVPQPYSLLDTMAQQIIEGRTTIVVEVARLSPAETPERLAERCVKYVEWGATALAICTDEETSPNGLADLTAVCKAVSVPVLRRDWIIHPLQIAETCEAGAAALTAVYSVLSKGLPAILNYTVSLGLDAVVEVINMKELQEVATLGIPIYGINLSVGLALSVPGIRQDISKSLIGEIPFGASSMVGVYSIDEARAMKVAGADAVYVRHEVLQGPRATEKDPQAFLEILNLKYFYK